jgi:hypothetical protein
LFGRDGHDNVQPLAASGFYERAEVEIAEPRVQVRRRGFDLIPGNFRCRVEIEGHAVWLFDARHA